jgi:intracellular sulfur oxidation DsrE/DsrF family protein
LRFVLRVFILLIVSFSAGLGAAESNLPASRYVADIELQTDADLGDLLKRAEQLLVDGELSQQDSALVLVLHGPVLHSLLRPNYASSKTLVNQAASLSALGVLEVKACRTWMGANGVNESQLQPFVKVVSYGADEVTRLVEQEGYIAF